VTKHEYRDLLIATSAAGLFPSVNKAGTCMYRSGDGRRCAVGLLIPDDVYKKSMDWKGGMSATRVMTRYEIAVPEGMTMAEVVKVQVLHDTLAATTVLPFHAKWDHEEFAEEVAQIIGD